MLLRLRIPASTANLGPGFDILAMAVQLQMEITGERREGGEVSVDAGDAQPPAFSDPARNLVCTSYVRACTALGLSYEQRGLHITVSSEIPSSRGLGSSAACTLGGVLLANGLRGDGLWDQEAVIQEAATIEGHPENVAAALLGGAVICAPGMPARHIEVPDELRCVLFIPALELSTQEARRVVPGDFPRADAVFNASRCAMIVRALMSGDLGDLGAAMEDRWHQPQRAALMPWLPAIIAAARAAGAHGAALSGAGPSVLALVSGETDTVAAAMRRTAERQEIAGTVRTVAVRNFGTRVDIKP